MLSRYKLTINSLLSLLAAFDRAPVYTIAMNAGAEGAVVVGELLKADSPQWGHNAATGEYCDMIAAGIIDPTKVGQTNDSRTRTVAVPSRWVYFYLLAFLRIGSDNRRCQRWVRRFKRDSAFVFATRMPLTSHVMDSSGSCFHTLHCPVFQFFFGIAGSTWRYIRGRARYDR